MRVPRAHGDQERSRDHQRAAPQGPQASFRFGLRRISGTPPAMRFTSRQRLRRTAEFEAVREKGRRVDCGTFLFSILLPASAEEELRRLGVIASKRVGPAVRRNAAKRRLREVFRLHQEQLPPRCDLVLIARSRLVDEPFARTEERFLKACRRVANEVRPVAR